MEDISISDWDWHMNVNLRSVFICTQVQLQPEIEMNSNAPHLLSLGGACACMAIGELGSSLLASTLCTRVLYTSNSTQ